MWLMYPGVEETLNKACSEVAKIIKEKEDEKEDICGECREHRLGDKRVEAGMKCGFCAYGEPVCK